MKLRDLARLALTNLGRSRTRTALATIGVTIGAGALLGLVGIGLAIEANVRRSIAAGEGLHQIEVIAPESDKGPSATRQGRSKDRLRLDDAMVARLERMPGVREVKPVLNLKGGARLVLGQHTSPVMVVGVAGERLAAHPPRMQAGSLFEDNSGWVAAVGARVPAALLRTGEPAESTAPVDLGPSPRGDKPDAAGLVRAVFGKTAALYLERIGPSGEEEVRVVRIRIAGILAPTGRLDDYQLFLPLDSVKGLNDWLAGRPGTFRREGYDAVVITVQDREYVPRVVSRLREEGFMAFSNQELLQVVGGVFRILQVGLGGVAMIAFLVAGLGVANTMLMAVYERTAEIGVLKVLGATPSEVRRLFLLEAGGMGLLGGTVAAVLVSVLALAANWTAEVLTHGRVGTVVVVSWPLVLLGVGFSAGVGILGGLYPAHRAANLSVLDTLRDR